jgi:hypothetical protein
MRHVDISGSHSDNIEYGCLLNVVSHSLVDMYGRSEVLSVIALMVWAVSSSETSDSIYQTTRRNVPRGSNLHACDIYLLHFGFLKTYLCFKLKNSPPIIPMRN